ncbi:MAG: Na+/H+ antiporter NhaA [Bacteroidetes bacterium]|nr:Na+/H+ antiporter NhaA [Bacteroidota bacterium]
MPITNRLTHHFQSFIRSQKFSGVALLTLTVVSLILSNSGFAESYQNFWEHAYQLNSFVHFSLEHLVNEGLMAFFFLLVGLEIKREFMEGELSGFEKASLPIGAALGGMIFPALIFVLFNFGKSTASGWGIPMATDIAFAIGILSLVGDRIPNSCKVLLTAIAVVDDLGAVIVIALFYTSSLQTTYLISAGGVFLILLLMNRFRVKQIGLYFIPGIFLWYFILQSGIHSTIAGVLLAVTIPLKAGNESPLTKLEHLLHSPVNLLIMPIFALANTLIPISGSLTGILNNPESFGISLGLIIGKPLGIVLFTLLLIKFKVSRMPEGLTRKHIIGLGFLGGIGFTMSVFISLLAFAEPSYVISAKLSILIASLISGVIGFIILKSTLNDQRS